MIPGEIPGTEGGFCFQLAGSLSYESHHTSRGTDGSGKQELNASTNANLGHFTLKG